MLTSDEAWAKFQDMEDRERLALKRCASYQMQQQDREEIGTSDVNCHAVGILQTNGWPDAEERGEVGLGWLVEVFSEKVEEGSDLDPRDVLEEMKRDGNTVSDLPDWAYGGKHILSREESY